MGIGGISPVQLIILLVIVLLIFGTKKLRNLGSDLGGAIKGFRKATKEEGTAEKIEEANEAASAQINEQEAAAASKSESGTSESGKSESGASENGKSESGKSESSKSESGTEKS